MKSMSFHTAALLADSINDASSTRKVYLLAAGLALLGIGLVVMTVWFWRSTRHDPELLGPLEVMGARRFRRLDGGSQQQVLDRSRPADAKPMRWGVVRGVASGDSLGEIDLRESMRRTPGSFDDLRDPALIAVALEQTDVDLAPGADPTVAPTFVPAAASAERDPLAEIDALLAQAGAGGAIASRDAPGDAAQPAALDSASPDPAASDPEASEPEASEPAAFGPAASGLAGTDPADRAEHAANSAATPEPAGVSPAASAPSDALATDDAHRDTTVEEPAAAMRSVPRGSKPGVAREVAPLVIVPVDHELRPNGSRPERRAESEPVPEPVDETAATVVPDDDEPASIDPLLRMFHRNDG